jgi:hypothetical protein
MIGYLVFSTASGPLRTCCGPFPKGRKDSMGIFRNQDVFNKVITLSILFFFMIMYIVSFVTGKSVNVENLLGFLLPVITHSTHLVYNARVNTAAPPPEEKGTTP